MTSEAPATTEVSTLLEAMRTRQHARIDALARLGDERMAARCVWAAQDVHVRFMLLRVAHHEDEHMLHLVKTLGWVGHQATETHQVLGAAQTALGEMYGALVGLADEHLDRVPDEPQGEWSLRTTLSHVLQVERSYRSAIITDVGIYRSGAEWHPHERVSPEEPVTSLADARTRFAAYRAETNQAVQDIAAVELGAKSVWIDVPLTVRFRILLLGYHVREHAEHVRKWRQQVGSDTAMTEAQRLLGLLTRARGATENVLVGVPDAALDRDPGNGEWTVRQILDHLDDVQERLTQRMLAAM